MLWLYRLQQLQTLCLFLSLSLAFPRDVILVFIPSLVCYPDVYVALQALGHVSRKRYIRKYVCFVLYCIYMFSTYIYIYLTHVLGKFDQRWYRYSFCLKLSVKCHRYQYHWLTLHYNTWSQNTSLLLNSRQKKKHSSSSSVVSWREENTLESDLQQYSIIEQTLVQRTKRIKIDTQALKEKDFEDKQFFFSLSLTEKSGWSPLDR